HELGVIGENAVNLVNEKLGDYKALLLGPGLGQEETTRTFIRLLLARESRVARSVLPGSFKRTGEEEPDSGNTEEREAGEEAQVIATPFGPIRRKSSRNVAPSETATLPPMVIDADGLNNLAQIENWPD